MFCGDQHCACIVRGGQGGQALTWGCGLYGQLGHFSTSNEFFPRKVEHLRDIDVASVACGHRHTMFLTGDGEVYSCGEGVDGKLGHGDEDTCLYPKQIKSMHGVTAAACGQHHSACIIGQSSTLYTFGSGTRGQLGYDNSDAVSAGNPGFPTLGVNKYGSWKSKLPKAVSAISGSTASGGVLEVGCGPLCTVAVTRDHQVWCWGQGPQVDALVCRSRMARNASKGGQATSAAGSGEAVMVPTRVALFPEEYVSGLAVGQTHAMLLVTRYPPGAEYGGANIGDEEDEEEQIEALATSCQEATFWATKFGYPVIIAPSEKIYRRWEGGERGPETELIRRCFTELQLRTEFQTLFALEEQRLRTAVVSLCVCVCVCVCIRKRALTRAHGCARG